MFLTDNSTNPFPDQYPSLKLPSGGLTLEDEKLLLKHSSGKKLVVDIGTFCGRSAIILSLESIKTVTIDVFDNHSQFFPDTTTHPWKKEQVLKTLFDFPNIEILHANSRDAVLKFKNNSIDMIFIDANHEYDGVKSDFADWYPKIKNKGIIIMHDNYEIFPGVIQFLDELREDRRVEFVELNGWSMVFRKVTHA
jgi:predicted O-methyltransferase YrrM